MKCPNQEQLKGKLEAIRKESNEAYGEFMNRGPKSFCRAYIEAWCKFDMIDNNICETFNSYIRKGREKSLLDMLEFIRENLMEWIEKQVRLMKRVKDKICLRIRKKLESIRKNTRHCIVKHAAREKFMSMFNEQFTMDLLECVCSCRWCSLTGNDTCIWIFFFFFLCLKLW